MTADHDLRRQRETLSTWTLEVCESSQVSYINELTKMYDTERVLRDLTWRAKVECGLAGISDIRWNTREDRMESFVLSETLKVRQRSLR